MKRTCLSPWHPLLGALLHGTDTPPLSIQVSSNGTQSRGGGERERVGGGTIQQGRRTKTRRAEERRRCEMEGESLTENRTGSCERDAQAGRRQVWGGKRWRERREEAQLTNKKTVGTGSLAEADSSWTDVTVWEISDSDRKGWPCGISEGEYTSFGQRGTGKVKE